MPVECRHARLGDAEVRRVATQLFLVLRRLLHQHRKVPQRRLGAHPHTLVVRKLLQLLHHLSTRCMQKKCSELCTRAAKKKTELHTNPSQSVYMWHGKRRLENTLYEPTLWTQQHGLSTWCTQKKHRDLCTRPTKKRTLLLHVAHKPILTGLYVAQKTTGRHVVQNYITFVTT